MYTLVCITNIHYHDRKNCEKSLLKPINILYHTDICNVNKLNEIVYLISNI